MALVMTPIYTQTVGAGGTSAIFMNNIPQVYTDLVIKMSVRAADSVTQREIGMYFNTQGFPAPSSFTAILGDGAATSGRNSSFIALGFANNAATTTNTFSSHEIYIPNYTSTNFKQIIVDSVTENNATLAHARLLAVLNRQSEAVTSLNMDMGGVLFLQHSTISLYGIIRSGA